MNLQASFADHDEWVMEKLRQHAERFGKYLLPLYVSMNVAVLAVVMMLFLFSLFLKRRSLQPGGCLYRYSRGKVQKIEDRRFRRIRDTLNDPLLREHMEARFTYTLGNEELAQAEIQSWRDRVARWEDTDEDDESKDAVYYRRRGRVVIPGLRLITWILVAMFLLSLPFADSATTMVCSILILIHMVDNKIISRKYETARTGRTAPSNNIFEGGASSGALMVPLRAEDGVATNPELNVV